MDTRTIGQIYLGKWWTAEDLVWFTRAFRGVWCFEFKDAKHGFVGTWDDTDLTLEAMLREGYLCFVDDENYAKGPNWNALMDWIKFNMPEDKHYLLTED